jgi:hypothetical protein
MNDFKVRFFGGSGPSAHRAWGEMDPAQSLAFTDTAQDVYADPGSKRGSRKLENAARNSGLKLTRSQSTWPHRLFRN